MPPSTLNIIGSLAGSLIELAAAAVGLEPNSTNTDAVSDVTNDI